MGRRGAETQAALHCTQRYLFFFLRSREKSLVFFLCRWMGHGGLICGKCQVQARPLLSHIRHPFCAEEGEGQKPPLTSLVCAQPALHLQGA
jgi:hypothetical protein